MDNRIDPGTGTFDGHWPPGALPEPELKPYSVMLQYPDYMDGGTYYEFVSARSPAQAIEGTRDMCMKENWNDAEERSFIDAPQDLVVLLCIEGHHHGL